MVRKLEDITYIEFQYLKKRQNKRPIEFDDVIDTVKSVSNFLERPAPSKKQVEKSLEKYQFLGENYGKNENQESKEKIELDYQVFRDLLFDLFDLESDKSKKIEHSFQHLQRQAEIQNEFMKQLDSFISHEKKTENESMASSKKSMSTMNTLKKEPKSQTQIEKQGTLNSMESYLQDREITYDSCGIRTVVTTIEPKHYKRKTENSIGENQSQIKGKNQTKDSQNNQRAYLTQGSLEDRTSKSKNGLSTQKVKQKAIYGLNDDLQKKDEHQNSQNQSYNQKQSSYSNYGPLYTRSIRKNNTLLVEKSSQEYQNLQDNDIEGRKRRESYNLRRYEDPYHQKTLNNIIGNQNIRAYKKGNSNKQTELNESEKELKRYEDSYHQQTINKLLDEQKQKQNQKSQQNEKNLIKQTNI